MDPALIDELKLESLDELRAEYPQFDHVKVWRAPYSGDISIVGVAELIEKNSCSKSGQNTFRLTIEHAASGQISPATQLGSFSLSNVGSTASTNRTLSVNKGDLVFFRVHNEAYGCGGKVAWNPNVHYTDGFFDTLDENDKDFSTYDAEGDYILSNGGNWIPHQEDGTLHFDFNLEDQDFSPYQFSDEVRFVVEQVRVDYDSNGQQIGNPYIIEFSRTYEPETGNFSGSPNTGVTINVSSTTSTRYFLRCYVESSSNIQWDAVQWRPEIPDTKSANKYPPITYNTFDDNVNQQKYWVDYSDLVSPNIDPQIPNDEEKPLIRVEHTLFDQDLSSVLNDFEDEEFPIKINWVTKEKVLGETKVLYKKTFYLHRGSPNPISGWDYKFTRESNVSSSTIKTSNPADSVYYRFDLSKEYVKDFIHDTGRLYTAFYIENKGFADRGEAVIKFLIHPDEEQNYPDYNNDPPELSDPFFSSAPTFFGIPFRGWGQFLYNGGLKKEYDSNHEVTGTVALDGPIDMAVFDKSPKDQQDVDNLEDEINNADPDQMDLDEAIIYYTFYNQENDDQTYRNTSILDAVYAKDGNELFSEVGRFGVADIYELYISPQDLLNGNGTDFIGLKQHSESKGNAISGQLHNFNGTKSDSKTNVLNQYIDLNGDRYPDLITEGKIQYSRMQGGLSSTVKSNGFSQGNRGEDDTFGFSIAGMFPNSTNASNNSSSDNKTITNVDAGINESHGSSFDSRNWIDINGDGLPDRVRITSEAVKVELNTGYGFESEKIWGNNYGDAMQTSGRSNISVGPSLNFSSSVAVGFGASQSTANTEAALVDVNGDGLPDLVKKNGSSYVYYLNTGIGFETQARPFYAGGLIDENKSISGNIFGSYTYGFTVAVLMFVTIKATISASAGVNANFNQNTTSLMDINGDGLPDILTQENGNASISAKLNQVGKTHLLKKVNTPLGGSWTVDYERKGNTYELPQSRWVMAKVETQDGFTGDNAFGIDQTLTSFVYENGQYDRRDRTFYGFEKVTSQQKDPSDSNNTYRYTVQNYHNQNYYLKGMVKETTSYTASGTLLSKTQNFYNMLDPEAPDVEINVPLDQAYQQPGTGELDRTRLFPAVVKSISTAYEDGQGIDLVKEFTQYDDHGNLETYIDRGEGLTDAYKAEISYDDGSYPGLPTEIKVYQNSTGELLRQRDATYNAEGKPDMITIHLSNTETNRVQFAYDVFGNTTSIIQLDNLGGDSGNDGGPIGGNDPFTQTLTYDDVVHTYPVEFSDAFGQVSSVVYNYSFGVPVLTTDMNGQQMRTRIDNRGRIIEVTGPNELAPNAPYHWTIRNQFEGEIPVKDQIGQAASNEYLIDQAQGQFTPGSTQSGNAQHYAITRHAVDGAAGEQLLTISIVDGLGQAIQEKKTSYADNVLKWQVGGFQQKDAFGRVTESYLPVVQTPYPSDPYALTAGDTEYFSQSPSSMIDPVVTTYDHRDRKLEVTQPGETQKKEFAYDIDGGMFTTTLTNELGQTQESFTDVRGRQRKTIQNGEITTQFYYNSINEMIKVIDTKGYKTNYAYDMAGRRIEEMSPDRGLTKMTYDKAGHLLKKQTANLMQSNQTGEIEYVYNYDRLRKIVYPHHEENNVEYIYGMPDNPYYNSVGRVVKQEDASGIQVFQYGKMGELTQRTCGVAAAGKMAYYFNVKWEYDSWNRIKQITYPDDEVVDYVYDPGGQLKKMERRNTPGNPNAADIVTDIVYDDYGQRKEITYGNGTISHYTYDIRRRLQTLEHDFSNFQIKNMYGYDALSNIISLSTANPTNSSPAGGALGGPVEYNYDYDNYNRLRYAEGSYVGPNDFAPQLLRQRYSLLMTYDKAHNITAKQQIHDQGAVASIGAGFTTIQPVRNTSYELHYDDYAEGRFQAGDYSYVQPHAPRKIVEYPTDNNDPDDPRVVEKLIDYDADGNQISIKRKTADPDDPLAENTEMLRRYLWDEEDRLLAVDLAPENDENRPEVANYTYDAEGQRSVRYVPEGLGAHYSAKDAGRRQHLATMLYPSPLLTVEALDLPTAEELPPDERSLQLLDQFPLTHYTKHYYIGSERIASTLGTRKNLGVLCEAIYGTVSAEIIAEMNNKVEKAGETLENSYTIFEKKIDLDTPYLYFENEYIANCGDPDPDRYASFWFHPDHLGSSNYITDMSGNISQHMEYLPFGETLVEEHKNSNNSPYKFNGKELDDETGNYYYGARYYNPKWSFWLSVDPLAERHPDYSPYAYTFHNPIKYVDPDGKDGIIYLVVLNSADRSQVNEMVQKTNARMEDMGLRTRVQVYAGSAETFDRRNLDKTDSFGVIGNKTELNTLLNKSPERFAGISEERNSKKLRNNVTPELADRTSSSKSGTGLGFVIKTDVMKQKAKEISESNSNFGSFLMMHALGHNSGLDHISEGSMIMSDGGILGNTFNSNGLYYNERGERITGKLNLQNFGQIFNGDLNSNYINAMEERFGSCNENGAASDNYFKNLRSIGPRE